MKAGSYTFVTAGTVNTNTSWVLGATVVTVGTDAANFNQFSSSGNVVLSLGGAVGAITTGNGVSVTGTVLSTSNGVDTNINTAKSGNYSLTSTDCGTTITGTGGPWTWTLPVVGGFPSACSITICNIDPADITHHAQRLSGFPAPSLGRLWMQQCETVTNASSNWEVTKFPGRFRPTFNPPQFFIDTGGSDTNDGLISNASTNALATIDQCFNLIQNEIDFTRGIIPQCLPTGGQVFTSAALLFGKGGSLNRR